MATSPAGIRLSPTDLLRYRSVLRSLFTTWDSAARWRARHWPTPTNRATGGSMPISPSLDSRAALVRPRSDRRSRSTLYALDSTTIDLCLSLFPWAKFRRHKAEDAHAAGLHGNIPTFIRLPTAKRTTSTRPRARRLYVRIGPTSFRTPLRVHNQEEHLAPTALLASRRQVHGRALGSDRHPGRHRIGPSVSGPVAAGQLLRCSS